MNSIEIPDFFIREEIRSGYKVTAEMKKVWAVQMNLMRELQRVCDKHNLRFWLDSGSLLGAVRHKGYIPWDDDIDVVMFREEYDRLVQIAKQEFHKPFIFQTAYTEKNFIRGHAQIRNTETSAIIPSEIRKKFNQGIFIDVFVLDGVSDDSCKINIQKNKACTLRQKLELLASPQRDFSMLTQWGKWIHSLRYKLRYPTMQSKAKLYRQYEDIFRETAIKDCKYVDKSTFIPTFRKIDKSAYDETIYTDFEYLNFPIPAGYDQILKVLYGDYMTPVNAPSMHGHIIFDINTPADIKIKQLRKNH